MTNLNGEKTVFLTNMFDEIVFKTEELCELYYKRWEIEVNYRNEKESLDINYFHSKNPNVIKQELYAGGYDSQAASQVLTDVHLMVT